MRSPRPSLRAAAAILLLAAALAPLAAADKPRQDAAAPLAASDLDKPKVFLEVRGFDAAELRKDIGFVEFVDSPDAAQVRVEVSAPSPAAPAVGAVLTFTGRGPFQGQNNRLTHVPAPGESPEETRRAAAGLLRMGLVRYAAKTRAGKALSVDFQEKVKPTAVADPWDFWVFSLSGNGFFMGESSYKDDMSNASFSAARVTPEWKIRASATADFGSSTYDIDGEILRSRREGWTLSGMAVKSLGEHWSAGAYVQADSSSYMNIDRRLTVMPALEYNPFKYSESTKRQLRFLYRLQLSTVRYREETIYNKIRQDLSGESLTATLELKRPWGTVSASLEGSHFFFDPRFYRVDLETEISFRVWKGLEFNIDGGGSRIHDQIFLPIAGASLTDVLLQRQQLATGYDYFFMLGVSFTFGSTRSQVVNPRFGNGTSGTSISIHM